MSLVLPRIEQTDTCPVINLFDDEKNIYDGSGWRLATFEQGRLLSFFDPTDFPSGTDLEEINNAASAYVADAEKNGSEVFLVMCSCYQLCTPSPVSLKTPDASSWKHMARIFSECA